MIGNDTFRELVYEVKPLIWKGAYRHLFRNAFEVVKIILTIDYSAKRAIMSPSKVAYKVPRLTPWTD